MISPGRWPVSRRLIADSFEMRAIRAAIRKGFRVWIAGMHELEEDSQKIFLRPLMWDA